MMTWWKDYWGLFLAAAAAVLVGVAAIVFTVHDDRAWARFKQQHECKVVAKQASRVIYSVDSTGKPTTHVVTGTTTWLCDDGAQYTR